MTSHFTSSSRLGMWIFLSSEVLLFGSLFVGYVVLRGMYPGDFLRFVSHMNVMTGTINTAILLTSSLCVALSANYATPNKKNYLLLCLILTMAFGIAFDGLKFWEYAQHISEGLIPTLAHGSASVASQHEQVFLWFYYVATGLHAVHVAIGVVLAGILAGFYHFSSKSLWQGPVPVMLFGLYWHFVDIVWIFLYPMLYLGRSHG